MDKIDLTLREETLKESIEETESHLYSVNVVLQSLNDLKTKNPICAEEITKIEQNLKNQKEFLEDIKQADLTHIELIKQNVLKSKNQSDIGRGYI